MIALGGVATGSMNANEGAMVEGRPKYNGLTLRRSAWNATFISTMVSKVSITKVSE